MFVYVIYVTEKEMLAKDLQVSHPDGNLEVQRKTGNSPRR